AIEARTSPSGAGHYMEYHKPVVAALYFLKAAELGAVVPYATQLIFVLALAGTAALWARRRSAGLVSASLLWLPLPFYVYSVAYGSVPIFIPQLWPHSYYNARYGMEMLPALAIYGAFAAERLDLWLRAQTAGWARVSARLWQSAAMLLCAANCIVMMYRIPLVLKEGMVNSTTRIPFERAVATTLETFPLQAPVLMSTTNHVGAV